MFILNNIVYEYILFEKKGKEDRGAMGKLIAASRIRVPSQEALDQLLPLTDAVHIPG